jgi:hypothetical protein
MLEPSIRSQYRDNKHKDPKALLESTNADQAGLAAKA